MTTRSAVGGKEPKRRVVPKEDGKEKPKPKPDSDSDSEWEDLDEEDQKVLKILSIQAKNRKKTKVEKVILK